MLAHLPENRINILLLGSDERSSDGEPPRTDTMLLLTLDLEGGTAGMISLARDLWLPTPGYNTTTKINTAYDLGERRGYRAAGARSWLKILLAALSGNLSNTTRRSISADLCASSTRSRRHRQRATDYP